jgi:hypothetical protein
MQFRSIGNISIKIILTHRVRWRPIRMQKVTKIIKLGL